MNKTQWIVGLVMLLVFVAALILTGEPKTDPLAGFSDKAYIEQALMADVTMKEVAGHRVVVITFEKPAAFVPEGAALSIIREELKLHDSIAPRKW